MRFAALFPLATLVSTVSCSDDTALTAPVSPGSSPVAAVTAAPEFTALDLGTLGGNVSGADAINQRNEVTGFAELPSGEQVAFLWRPGQGMRSLGTLGGPYSEGTDINERGDVVGFSPVIGSDVFRAFQWTEASGMRDLGTLGGAGGAAAAINNRGEVAGSSETTDGALRAFLKPANGDMRDLGTLGGAESFSFATDINDASEVVGISTLADGSFRAFLWTARGGMEDLGTLGDHSFALGISRNGDVVGSNIMADGTEEPFLWTRGRGMQSLGRVGAFASGVNAQRQVVGTAQAGAFLWTPASGMQTLPTLGGTFAQAFRINEFGAVAGFSHNLVGALRATVWIPASGDLLANSWETAEPAHPGAEAIEIAAQVDRVPGANSVRCAFSSRMVGGKAVEALAGRFCLPR